jgi:hypothetical protein
VAQFFTPAEASAIPLLVGKNDLELALSLFSITLTIAQALGFLVLGGLITTLFPPFRLSLGFLACRFNPLMCSLRLSPLSMYNVSKNQTK